MEDKSQMQDSHPSQVQQHQSYSDSKANESSATNKSASILNAIQKRRNNSIEGIDSLNLLKDNLQYYFNQKIQNVMNEFVSTYFDPAIKNIEKYTDETITGEQINNLCTDLLYSVKYKYPSKPLASCSLLQDNAIVQIKDDKTNLSLLHQALKRKRSDSETEQLFKRQFFLSSAPKSTPTSTRQIFHIIQAPEKKDSC